MHTVVLVGKMQSGKSSAANMLVGEVMKRSGMVPEYSIDDLGILHIPYISENKDIEWGEFDLSRVDYSFTNWCNLNLWDKVKVFNFADPLKHMIHKLFNIPLEKLYGSNEDKDSLTKYTNKDLKADGPLDKVLTIRELLQKFADLCRDVDKDCFLNATRRNILDYQSNLNIVADCRFVNEIHSMRDFGAKIIRLKRNPIKSNHKSETEMNEIKDDFYDLVIPAKFSIQEKNEIIIEHCEKWGYL